MSVADLISQGYGGYQGWDEAGAAADFAATGGAGKKTSGGSSGSGTSDRFVGGIDESQIPSTLDYMEKLNATEDTAFNDLVMAMRARKSPLDVYSELETASGLPAYKQSAVSLSKEINNLEDTLDTVEPDVAARSRESLVTEAQRRGIVTQRKEPLLEKLGKFTTGLGRLKELISLTGQDIGTKANLYMQGVEQNLEPVKMKYTALVDRNARLITGFTSDKETKLSILMDKLNRQRELSDQEWQLANTLKADETSYTRQLQKAAADAGYKVSGAESNDELLGIIGTQAAKAIAKQGAGAGVTTAQKQEYAKQVASDARAGMTLNDIMTKYAGKLDTNDIVKGYTGSSIYGTPKEDWAREVLGLSNASDPQTTTEYWMNLGYSAKEAAEMALTAKASQ